LRAQEKYVLLVAWLTYLPLTLKRSATALLLAGLCVLARKVFTRPPRLPASPQAPLARYRYAYRSVAGPRVPW